MLQKPVQHLKKISKNPLEVYIEFCSVLSILLISLWGEYVAFLITLDKELIARQNFIFHLSNCWLAIEDTVLRCWFFICFFQGENFAPLVI